MLYLFHHQLQMRESMAAYAVYNLSQSQTLLCNPSTPLRVFNLSSNGKPNTAHFPVNKRCNTLYLDRDNSPIACSFHGHINGEKGMLALAPPHQGIDGVWSEGSGVIVYKWNDKDNRPNSGFANWKKRWSCCSEYGEDAPPCRKGWHVSYDDGFTLY